MAAEMWRALFKNMDESLADSLAVKKVSVSRASGAMKIEFEGSRILGAVEEQLVRRTMEGGFPGVPLTITYSYSALAGDMRQSISSFVPLIMRRVSEESPGAAPFLGWSPESWRLNNRELLIGVSSKEGLTFLNQRNVAQIVENAVKELFGTDVSVRFEIVGNEQEQLRRIAEKREAELLRMAETHQEQEAKEAPPKPAAKSGKDDAPADPNQIVGKLIEDPSIKMQELSEDVRFAVLTGEVTRFETKEGKSGQTIIVSFDITDRTASCTCKMFLGGKRSNATPEQLQEMLAPIAAAMKPGAWVTVRGSYRFDEFSKEMTLLVNDAQKAAKPVRKDNAERKRVELHMHSQMSSMDATASAKSLIAQAAAWGHPAVAITDHGVVQSFPAAFGAAKANNIKFIPGCEGYLMEDTAQIVLDADGRDLKSCAFVVLDVETTGLNTSRDEIIEIGAVRFENGEEVGEFSELIDPGIPIPEKITEITGISTSMLAGKPKLHEVIGRFYEFAKDAVVVAHNAAFDTAFFRRAYKLIGKELDAPVLDTLALVRCLHPEYKNHKLGTICKMMNVSLKNAHRAVHDSRATALCLMHMLQELDAKGAKKLNEINGQFKQDNGGKTYHIIILAKTQKGLANLNRLVSEAHLNHFHRTPRIPRSLIEKWRDGLIIGSACEAGELYRAIVAGRPERDIERIAKFYDYLEIQPLGNNAFMVENGTVESFEELQDINRRIVALGDRLGIPVVATGDVHFKEPEDAIFRSILMAGKGFEDADNQPPLYFKTTDEMLEDFAYLGAETAMRVVVDAPNQIADSVEKISLFIPHPEGKTTFQPLWETAADDLRSLTENRAKEIYGEPLPEIVRARIDKELGSIIGYGFSTLYMIAVKLVSKSLSDGYIVGSRGSVGSSFVANMSGITEVNSLPPHYVCPKCKHNEFNVPKEYTCGLDLPPKKCPECGADMDKDGFNIPFEVFLGFKGDKVPDIDLNFSGEYQPVAHNYVKELFGKENVFRAGTIGGLAEKTALGYVLKYMEERGMTASQAEKLRLAAGITGVKRTTGQHPAGMVVLPKGYEIYQFTAIQHPADDTESETITTHFDFNSMHDILVKLDILGHDDPTMLRKLQDLTGIAPQQVPLHDPEVFGKIISLFSGPEALGVTEEEIGVPTGTLGIPEFGTKFVRGMLVDTRPTSMEELIRISGLSHGTDVWLGNAQDIIRAGIAPLKGCICTRDDIMNQLMDMGVPAKMAFDTMENVRKGKGLKPEMEAAMREANTPEWFIDSCKKIKYMFPKAHAVAYVTMALRIAYFKVFYPGAYYTCYLKRNAESFDATRMVTSDLNALRQMIKDINALDKKEREHKDGEITILEILIEMNARGIHVLPVDIYRSHPTDYLLLDEHTILPPITSLPGVGQSAAENFCEIRKAGPFISEEDMIRRKVGRGVVDTMRVAGCLGDMPATSQVSLFDF